MKYVNLDLELSAYQRDSSNNESFFVRVVRSDFGNMPSDSAVHVALTSEKRKQISHLKRRGLSKDEIIERGEELGKMLFPPNTQVRRIYDKCVNGLEGGQRLRIRLTVGNYALSDLPWEYSYILPADTPQDQKDVRGFLVLKKNISLVRYLAIEQRNVSLDPVEKGNLRLAVIMANPKNDPFYPELEISSEFEKIREVLGEVPEIILEPFPDATRQTVQDALMKPAHIFHFAGHGDFEGDLGSGFRSTSGKGHIILLDDEGKGKRFPADKLASLLAASQVRLTVLTACETGATDQINAWTGVVPAIIREGIPAVVGMQFKIEDQNAIAFSRQFYLALAEGRSIDEAVAEGRLAIFIKGRDDERDWGVPVLYLQTDRGVLFPPDAVATIRAGICLLKDEISKSQEVRHAASLSKEKIEYASQQIDEMGLFKAVHDALHRVEHECLRPMRESDCAFITPYKREFDKQSLRIQQAIKPLTKNPLLEDLFEELLDRLKATTEDFQIVVNLPDNAGAAEKSASISNVVSKLEELLSGLPASFDRSILEAARMLNLDRLVDLLTKVRDTVSLTDPGQEVKHKLLIQSIDNIKKFQEELILRVKEHNRLQMLDDKLRTVCVGQTVQNERDLQAEWNRIKEIRSKLKAPFSPEMDDANDYLVAIERDIEEAIEGRHRDNAKNLLSEYFRSVGKVFSEADSSLKSFCEKLNQVGEPLKVVLEQC